MHLNNTWSNRLLLWPRKTIMNKSLTKLSCSSTYFLNDSVAINIQSQGLDLVTPTGKMSPDLGTFIQLISVDQISHLVHDLPSLIRCQGLPLLIPNTWVSVSCLYSSPQCLDHPL